MTDYNDVEWVAKVWRLNHERNMKLGEETPNGKVHSGADMVGRDTDDSRCVGGSVVADHHSIGDRPDFV